MFSSNKAMVIATLLTGTAVASGTLFYGYYTSEKQDLIILDDTLPPILGNGLLPPPATYVMKTPPPADIPGIRRLKIMRPTITGAGTETAQSDEDFYLTGTRSSELIRGPVEARIETFPTVSLDEAAEGALSVDEWGFQVVQSYLNQALGDDEALKMRMSALIERLEAMASDYDLGTLSDAANLIIEAGARAHWSAFMSPFVLDKSFKLQEDAIGWDFGPSDLQPYDKFTRVGANSEMLQGEHKSDEGNVDGASILRNGVRNVEQFVASGLKNGMYRVVILTAPRFNGASPLYPFGVDFKRNGGKVNMVDTRATDDLVPVMRLTENGPGRLSGAGTAGEASSDDAFDRASGDTSERLSAPSLGNFTYVASPLISADPLLAVNRFEAGLGLQSLRLIEPLGQVADFAPFFQANNNGTTGAPEAGHMLVTRAEVVDGTLRLNFRQLGGQDTYVTAVIIYPEPDVDFTEELTAEIVEFIEKVAPAAQGLPENAEDVMTANLPIVSVEEVFADNAAGLPSDEAQAATPDGDPEPVAAAAPEPDVEPDPEPEPAASPEPEPDDAVAGDVAILEPEPTPEPEVPAPDPEPEVPVPDPEPEVPVPEPEPEVPVPEPEPELPVPEPEPEAPVPEPEPEPQPKELVLDAGGGGDEVYDPVLLGEDFLLDGCGSTFEGELLCSLTSTNEFEIVWILNGEEMGTGEQLLVQTGSGTNFDNTGDISISTRLRYDGRLLENGEIINVLTGGSLFLPGDIILTSLDTAFIRIYSVAEPGAAFLLAPGLFYLARRERRRRKPKKKTA